MLNDFLIIDKRILPDYFQKVVEARALLEQGKVREVSQAVKKVGISRSTYYKYKDYVLSPSDVTIGRKAVLSMLLSHEIGVLSTALNELSSMGVNVLTISQSLPVRDSASVIMTLDVARMEIAIEEAISRLSGISGVENAYLVAIE